MKTFNPFRICRTMRHPRFALTLRTGLTAGLLISGTAIAQTTQTGEAKKPEINIDQIIARADPVQISGQGSAINYAPAAQESRSDPLARDLILEATLTQKGAAIENGIIWRIFKATKDSSGKLPLVATATGGTSELQLLPGDYLVHAAFGRASATKKVTVAKQGVKENFNLNAGGLMLTALAGQKAVSDEKQLRFSIYSGEVDENGERKLISQNVPVGQIVRLNADIYHVVSSYGLINATVRADLKVQAGKLVEATLEHHAAKVTLKLVANEGGEALADTAWSIVAASGAPIRESATPTISLVLAEGSYSAIAKNGNDIYTHDFRVESGIDAVVEVVAEK